VDTLLQSESDTVYQYKTRLLSTFYPAALVNSKLGYTTGDGDDMVKQKNCAGGGGGGVILMAVLKQENGSGAG